MLSANDFECNTLECRMSLAKKMLTELNDEAIRIIAPASSKPPEIIRKIVDLFPKKPLFNKNIFDVHLRYNVLANTNEQRRLQLKEALLDDELEANVGNPCTVIWCISGGYGSAYLDDVVENISTVPSTKKVLIGYSDITALHLMISQKFNWYTIHGAVLMDVLNQKRDVNLKGFHDVCGLISGRITSSKITGLIPLNNAAEKVQSENTIRGKLTGGNLSIVQTSIGTWWQIQTNRKIIFLEDINEPSYKLDRILKHLRSAKTFDEVGAIVLGNYIITDLGKNDPLERFAEECEYIPVYKVDAFGHGLHNHPLVYNADATLLSENGSFTLLYEVNFKT